MAERVPAFRRDRPRLPAAARRRQIVDVATSLIADRGFWGVSMQDIADRCGLTVPGLLRHMESKVGLLIAVLEHRDVEDARSLRDHLGTTEDELPDDWAAGGPAGVSLRRLCAATMQRNATQPEIVRLFTVLAAESLEPTHPAHDYFARRQEQAAAAYAALAGHLTDQPEVLARQILAMMDGLQMQWLRSPEATDLMCEWETAAEALFARFALKRPGRHTSAARPGIPGRTRLRRTVRPAGTAGSSPAGPGACSRPDFFVRPRINSAVATPRRCPLHRLPPPRLASPRPAPPPRPAAARKATRVLVWQCRRKLGHIAR
jgi:AcrR family transcriptional regulator